MQLILRIVLLSLLLNSAAQAAPPCESNLLPNNQPPASHSEAHGGPDPWLLPALKKVIAANKVRSVQHQQALNYFHALNSHDKDVEAQRNAYAHCKPPPQIRDLRERIEHYLDLHGDALNNLPWLDLVGLVKNSSHLESLNIGAALSEAIFANPASLDERRETLKQALSNPQSALYKYIDEILGIPKVALQRLEHQQMEDVDLPQHASSSVLGIGATHDFWFSDYRELLNIADYMRAAGLRRVGDLGTGTGRLGLLIGFLYPELEFVGLEIDSGRVEAAQNAAQRWGFGDRILFIKQDLLDTEKPYPTAQLYFIYGPTNLWEINAQVIARLKAMPGSIQIASPHTWVTVPLISGQGWIGQSQFLKARGQTQIFGADPTTLAKFKAKRP